MKLPLLEDLPEPSGRRVLVRCDFNVPLAPGPDGTWTIADDLRLYRSIATMDAEAPLPPLAPTPPDWARAAAWAAGLGLNALSTRLAARTS